MKYIEIFSVGASKQNILSAIRRENDWTLQSYAQKAMRKSNVVFVGKYIKYQNFVIDREDLYVIKTRFAIKIFYYNGDYLVNVMSMPKNGGMVRIFMEIM